MAVQPPTSWLVLVFFKELAVKLKYITYYKVKNCDFKFML